jgi:hypothetical protein
LGVCRHDCRLFRTLCNFFCEDNANFNLNWIFFLLSFCRLSSAYDCLMNRTLTYASLHARDALQTSARSPVCWSCSVTGNSFLQVQYHVLWPISRHPRAFSTSTRCLSTKRAKQKTPYVSPKIKTKFPLLKSELPTPPRRSKEAIREEARQRWKTSRTSTERARLDAIASKPKTLSTETTGKLKKSPVSARTVLSPKASLSSASTIPIIST